MRQNHNHKADQREAKIVTACVLRFDGYRYADEQWLADGDFDTRGSAESCSWRYAAMTRWRGYRNEGYCREWERRHRPGLRRHLEFVRQRNERTAYKGQTVIGRQYYLIGMVLASREAKIICPL